MNEQLQNALTEILNKTINGIDSSVEFMEAQLPDVIEQLLMWYMVKSVAGNLGAILLIAISLFAAWKTVKFMGGKNALDYVHLITPVSVVCPFVIFFSIVALDLEWLQIWIAPKLWLIEYAANLVN